MATLTIIDSQPRDCRLFRGQCPELANCVNQCARECVRTEKVECPVDQCTKAGDCVNRAIKAFDHGNRW